MATRAWFALIVLLGATATTYAQWWENGTPVADTSWRKAWGTSGAMLLLTDKPNEFFAAWEQPGTAVPMSTTEIAKRGDSIVGVVLFSGCTANATGVCETEVEFQVFRPDGSPYNAAEKTELWSGKPPPAEGQLQLSVGAIGVRIEPTDPSGTYTVRARVVDIVSRAEVELTRTFSVDP